MSNFVSLHTHTDGSLLDGLIKVPDLVKFIKDYNMPAIAITDHGNLFNAIPFIEETKKQEVKGIVGQEFYLVDESTRLEKQFRYHIVLLAKNNEGYRNLLELTTLANTKGFYMKPRIDKDLLYKYRKGLICSSACLQGEVARAILYKQHLLSTIPQDLVEYPEEFFQTKLALDHRSPEDIISDYLAIFGEDFYLEIMDNKIPEQYLVNDYILQIADTFNIKTILTSDAHYLMPEDRYIHDILLCNQTGSLITDITKSQWKLLPEAERQSKSYRFAFEGEAHMLSDTLISQILLQHPSYKSSIDNTFLVSQKCEPITLRKSYTLPDFSTPEKDSHKLLSIKAKWGLVKKFNDDPNQIPPNYKERLQYELDTIKEMDFSNYFLVVNDYVSWANRNGCLHGAGRGSGVGSLVLYVLGITKIDPIQYNLVFQRFINKGRKDSLPDIDLDWSTEDRDQILSYLKTRWEEDKVAEICTFTTIQAKSAVKDVTRILGLPYSMGEEISNAIPNPGRGKNPTFTFADKDTGWQKFVNQSSSSVQEIIKIARKLEGVKKAISIHAGGIIISGDRITKRAPLIRHKDNIICGYDMESTEKLGLIKFDILRVSAIQTINNTLRAIKLSEGVNINLQKIDMKDPKVFETFHDGKTEGIFQFDSATEGNSITSLAQEVGVEKIEDLCDTIALYRPGILDNDLQKIYLKNKNKKRNEKESRNGKENSSS